MKLLFICITFLFFGCIESNELYIEDATTNGSLSLTQDLDMQVEIDACVEQWLCWNTESDLHGGPCLPGCRVPGDNHTFCYFVECE